MPTYKDNKTGLWYCKFYYTDYTGQKKQKLKRGFKLQREAKDWERDFLEHKQRTPSITFQALYDQYIEDIEHRLRQNSVEGKKNVFKNRILPYFKDKPINQITPMDIREWQTTQIKQGYSDAYLERIQNMMTTIMNYAVNYYDLPNNPCAKAGRMGKRTKSMKFWTLGEYKKALSHITDPTAYIAFQVLFFSGMRFVELIALTYGDLDFKANTINIDKSAQWKASKRIITPPKTDNGIRTVSMPSTVMQELKEYTNKIYGIEPEHHIFNFTKTFIRGNIRRSAEKAEIKYIRIHDLRHSHVSLLIDMGFFPHLIADRIGDTVQMVNNTYGHLYPDRHEEVAEKLDKILVSN